MRKIVSAIFRKIAEFLEFRIFRFLFFSLPGGRKYVYKSMEKYLGGTKANS